MSIWKRVKNLFGESVDIISESSVGLSNLAKLKWEHHKIQQNIDNENTEFGAKVYHMFIENQQGDLKDQTDEIIENLKLHHKQLIEKNQEIEALGEEKVTVDSERLRQFRKDLELGGGAIEQIIVEENSSIVNKKLAEIELPKKVLLGAIVREGKVIIPDGQTVIKKDDRVTILGEIDDVEITVKALTQDNHEEIY